MAYKVEFLSTAHSVDGSPEWISNKYRYLTKAQAADHFASLCGQEHPSMEYRIVNTDEPANVAEVRA